MLNKIFNFWGVKVVWIRRTLRFFNLPYQVAIRIPIVEKLPEEWLIYEYRGVFVEIVKKRNCWEWSVTCGCIRFETGKCATKEEAIVSAEARIDKFCSND